MKQTYVFIIFIVAANLVGCGMRQIDEGFKGIPTRFGKIVGDPLQPGLHFYNPFTSDIEKFEIREQKKEDSTQCFTADTQNVTIQYSVTYYPDPLAVNELYAQFGPNNWDEKTVPQAVLGSLKDAIGQYKADDLVAKREAATRFAEAAISEALSKRKIVVTRLEITNLDFNDEYEKAVEDKVTAIQNSAAEKNKTQQIIEQAKQKVETAKAEAEAMRIKNNSLNNNPKLIEYEYAVGFRDRWDGALPVFISGSNSGQILDVRDIFDKIKK